MFRTRRLLWAMLSILLFSGVGCVRTVQPILRDDQVIMDHSVVGQWVTTDGKMKLDVRPNGPDDRNYKVIYTDDKDKTGNFIVRLGKVDSLVIAEIHPAEPLPAASDIYKAHLLSLYSFLVVDQTTPQLTVSSLSIDWLKKYIRNNPADLETTPIGTDDFVVSGSTDDFQAFFLKHFKDDGAMGEKTTFVRP